MLRGDCRGGGQGGGRGGTVVERQAEQLLPSPLSLSLSFSRSLRPVDMKEHIMSEIRGNYIGSVL